MDKKRLYPLLALLMVQLSFGSLPVTGKVVMQTIPAMGLVGFRVGVTAFVLIVLQTIKDGMMPQRRKDIWWFVLLSFFGVTFNQICFVKGLSLTKASNAALLAVTIPIFTLIISTILGKEKLRRIKVLGIILAACGVLIVINPANAGFTAETTIGDFLVIMNSLCYGIFVVISKDVFIRNGALKSTAWIFGLASLICVPLAFVSMRQVDTGSIGIHTWLLTLFIAGFCTALPYSLVAWAIARVSPSTVAVFVYLQPLFGFLMAVIFLNEQISLWTIVAGAIIFSGVYLVTKKGNSTIQQTENEIALPVE